MKNNNYYFYKAFEKNLPKIIKSPLNSLHQKEEKSFESFNSPFNDKTSRHFIPYMKERDNVGKLLSNVNKIY